MTWFQVRRPIPQDPDFPHNFHLGTEYYDEVDFCHSMSCEDVKRSLIEHDGYPTDIIVKCQEKEIEADIAWELEQNAKYA